MLDIPAVESARPTVSELHETKMTRYLTTSFAALLIAAAAFAHSGVKDPQVMARMNGMSAMEKHNKTLGEMVKGTVAFDKTAATQAIEGMKVEAAKTVALFEPAAQDPKSEALPAIWNNWENFVAQSEALQNVLERVTINDASDLRPTFRDINRACSACHKDYRK